MEEWRNIKGYEGRYQISSFGRVKSLIDNKGKYREKILKQRIDKGYLKAHLTKNGKQKTYSVHRLVAQAFIPNLNSLPCINHKDEDKTNNHVSNLEWCDYNYNNNYGTRNEKISKKNKENFKGKYKGKNNPRARKVICITTGEKFNYIREASNKYNIKNHEDITRACQGKRRSVGKHPITGKPLKWKYWEE